MSRSRVGIRAGSAVLAALLLFSLGACGSSSKSTASTGTTAAASSAVATTLPHVVACLQRSGWRVGSSAAGDAASKALQTQPGYVALLGAQGPKGGRATIAIFKSEQEAAHAQVAVGHLVPAHGHATATPGKTIAWINYSGRNDVDQAVAACA